MLCSVLPASHYFWNPKVHPAKKIVRLNKWIEKYARDNGYTYLNYYPHLVNNDDGMQSKYSKTAASDLAGYGVMDELVVATINKTLEKN